MIPVIKKLLASAGTLAKTLVKDNTQRAKAWFSSSLEKLKGTSALKPGQQSTQIRNTIKSDDIGSMFMFYYDPKTKDKLPYYDRFPVIFVVDMAQGGYYGINLHYLPPFARAKLMNALYDVQNTATLEKNRKLALSYRMLIGASRLNLFKPCFKHYLFTHVRSKFIKVEYEEWDTVAMLPLQQFQKASADKVWAESLKIAGR